MTKAFEEMKREIAYKMTPQEFNQFLLDYVCGNVHAKCMDTCLDEDQTDHEMWDAQRQHLGGVCGIAAGNSQNWLAHINRFNTHKLPAIERIKRERAVRDLARQGQSEIGERVARTLGYRDVS
jgi:hypothetical protein